MALFEMFPTIITPFHDDLSIDYESLERLIDEFHNIGCDGIFAVCQSSEMFFLTDHEKLALAEKSIAFCRARGMKCVVSGHTQDSAEEQIAYLKRLEALNPDAVILVSNRLAKEDEGEETAVKNLQRILESLKRDTRLGIYECPHPYKRPLSNRMLEAMKEDGRFLFVKDTCCRIETILKRIEILKGSGIGLYNANMATLLESMDAGASGYSGVMLNIMPEFFGSLRIAYEKNDRVRIECIMEYLSAASIIECQNYPANAKYIMTKRGIFQNTLTRNGNKPMTESQKKETDSFIGINRKMYYNLLRHEPFSLLFGYDTAFPECHASSVLPLDNGDVLVAYFAGAYEKADDVGIFLSERRGGEWKKPRLIAKVNQSAHWNPVIFSSGNGIRIVFKVGFTIPGWVSYQMYSADQGRTWTKPELLSMDNPAGGPVRNKPIVLSNGWMLGPSSDETEKDWLPRIDISANGGKTFERLSSIPINRENPLDTRTYMKGKGAIQPAVWESREGHVHALLRTDAGYIYRSDSEDFGKTWSAARKTALPNNNSGIDIAKCKDTLYLVMNPVGESWGARTPLIIMKSDDNGNTFTDFCTLADDMIDDVHGRNGQFCYPSIAEKDGRLFISFTYNRKSIAYCEINTGL